MWYQESDVDPTDTKPVEKFMVKWNGMSYLHVSWETMGDLIELANPAVKMQVCTFYMYLFTCTFLHVPYIYVYLFCIYLFICTFYRCVPILHELSQLVVSLA